MWSMKSEVTGGPPTIRPDDVRPERFIPLRGLETHVQCPGGQREHSQAWTIGRLSSDCPHRASASPPPLTMPPENPIRSHRDKTYFSSLLKALDGQYFKCLADRIDGFVVIGHRETCDQRIDDRQLCDPAGHGLGAKFSFSGHRIEDDIHMGLDGRSAVIGDADRLRACLMGQPSSGDGFVRAAGMADGDHHHTCVG